MLKIFHANLETSHFTFDGYFYSKTEAKYGMRKAWLKHRRQAGATYKWSELEDSVNITEVLVGSVYRDGTMIHRQTGKAA